ncbi:MAG TPA: NAD(P)/FAD-dependent oxidoreductase [Syntrophomonadaceae bacterium]|nr:NAD(P)/FAD-dependent oxidoreductase [Syntrophomonadaceae bacterium]
MMKKVIVIGAGPAGMMAAATAAENGAQVILLEKKAQVGKKLEITGKGRCNITSALENNFTGAYPRNGKFLFSALNEFSNFELINFFNSRGLMTKVERGKRVFPVTDNAKDVVKVLYENLVQAGVTLHTNAAVQKILVKSNKITGLATDEMEYSCDAVIVATGGMSYPGTGSTGDGYIWAKDLGHTIVELRPSLVPLVTQEKWVRDLKGLSLKNVQVTLFQVDGKKMGEEFGEMLFTHFGVSGPIILSLSSNVSDYFAQYKKEAKLFIDLKPALDEDMLENRLQRDFAKFSRKQFKNSLDQLLPKKLIPLMISLSEIDGDKQVHQITRAERKRLLGLLKQFPLTITGTRPIKEAVVTAGGVDVKEVDPKTMESKIISSLFFAGEVLDVDGYTGGFNLQAAFSTGFVAGKYASGLYS